MAAEEEAIPKWLLAHRWLSGAELLEKAKRKEEEKKNERRNP